MWYTIIAKALFQITFIAICIKTTCAGIPDYIERCNGENNMCILKNINSILTNKSEGDASFGLPQLDPIKIGTIAIKEDAKNPVSINITFDNTLVLGLKDAIATKVKGFGKNPTGRHEVLIKSPHIILLADYNVNGKVLILPVRGQGRSNLTMLNAQMKISIDAEATIKNDELYMDVQNTHLDIICEQIIMHFKNLFEGDKSLGENVNAFINENWREIYAEMKAPILEALSKPLHYIVKRVFDTTPYTGFVSS